MAVNPIDHDHPVRGRINAWLLLALDGYMHRKYGARKTAWFRDTAGIAVEIGPGTGANLRYVGRDLRLIAIEPNRRMRKPLLRRARDLGIDLELIEASAEATGLPDASVDMVFCSLVLCTVERPEAVLSEVRRILKRGGRFTCIEHVCAPRGSYTHRVQRALERPWR